MNEDRKKRGLANGKFFTAVAICALFLGSGNVMAAQTASDDSQGVQEQMQSISVTVTVVDTKGEPDYKFMEEYIKTKTTHITAAFVQNVCVKLK